MDKPLKISYGIQCGIVKNRECQDLFSLVFFRKGQFKPVKLKVFTGKNPKKFVQKRGLFSDQES